MSRAGLLALLPLLVLAGGIALTLLQVTLRRNVKVTVVLSLATLVCAAAGSALALPGGALPVTALLRADGYALIFTSLFCLGGAFTVLFSADLPRHGGDEPEEYFLLLLLSTLGGCVLAYADHLAALILGLELLSVSLYALIAYPDRALLPLEAAIKYLVLSGAASATLLFGFALLYGVTGTLAFPAMQETLGQAASQSGATALTLGAAAVLVAAGLLFKLSLVPFHLWTPDVYQGAPSAVTGFLATVSKGAVFAVMLRWFTAADLWRFDAVTGCLLLIAILSMLGGNLLALLQTSLKRILAYSSIAHMGYLLIVIVVAAAPAQRELAREAAVFYLIAYTATTLVAFGVLSRLTARRPEREDCSLQDVSGLFWRNPFAALLLLAALLSLAGIPLTAGFLAKFYVVGAAVSGSHWGLLAALVAGSGIGIFYYLRVVYYMSRRPEEHGGGPVAARGWQWQAGACLLLVVILVLGIVPQPLLDHLQVLLAM